MTCALVPIWLGINSDASLVASLAQKHVWSQPLPSDISDFRRQWSRVEWYLLSDTRFCHNGVPLHRHAAHRNRRKRDLLDQRVSKRGKNASFGVGLGGKLIPHTFQG